MVCSDLLKSIYVVGGVHSFASQRTRTMYTVQWKYIGLQKQKFQISTHTKHPNIKFTGSLLMCTLACM